jgi:hypothetical protein
MQRRISSHSSRRLRFESLEDRALMAGNVTAAVVNGTLQITGDNSANVIQIQQAAGNGIRVVGVGTTINGSSAAGLFYRASNIALDMQGGNDSVTASSVRTGALTGSLGDGNDTVTFNNVVSSQGLALLLGAGDDTANISGGRVTGDLGIDGEAGNDSISISRVQISGGLTLTGSDGDDKITVGNAVVGSTIEIDGDDGNDTVSITNSRANELGLFLGEGDNTANLALVRVTDAATMTGLSGKDTITASTLTVGTTLSIDTGDQTDNVSLTRATATEIDVDMGLGNLNRLSLGLCSADVGQFNCDGSIGNLIALRSSHFTAQTITGFQIIT